MVKKELVVKIEKNLKRMDLPAHRKSITSDKAIQWLKKNLSFKNSEHRVYKETISMLGEL